MDGRLGAAAAVGVALISAVRLWGADGLPVVAVEGQPLAANVERLLQALEFLGAPLDAATVEALGKQIRQQDARQIQETLDRHVLVQVTLNPEARVKATRGPAVARLQQAGYTPVVIKVINESTVKKPLNISSPQAGPVYSDPGRQSRDPKADPNVVRRFLQVEMFRSPPMTAQLSGLAVEYVIALIYSRDAGLREATLAFDVGQGTQDLGFRGEVPILFEIRPAIEVRLKVRDFDGTPTVGRFTFTDKWGHVYPPQAKRLAPDFFFQRQIYRPDGGTVLLPPGEFEVEYGRGPEYRLKRQKVVIPDKGPVELSFTLERWIHPAAWGWYSGDHHIHAAGCAHYTNPTEGVLPQDMFLHVKGEGLNVGCCLTWGPCYEYQRQFFEPRPWSRSEPFTILKYDVEVSGFGSQALGHVCLLNLKDQTYPGSEGTKYKGWPSWTTPLMRWAKAQGAVTGYAHSASGLGVQPDQAVRRLIAALDNNRDGRISPEEARQLVLPLPEPFARVDRDGDGQLTAEELLQSTQRTLRQLPNLNIPQMDGIGAQEVCVTTAMGVCDFLSAMDTDRIPEWNCWYHILNCGFPLKISGETDFPCISGSRVGQGRVYVQMGKIEALDFAQWCSHLAKGRSYVSDGYAHALEFTVNGVAPGFATVHLNSPDSVRIKAKVAFGSEVALGTAPGAVPPQGKTRRVEVVVNGQVMAHKDVPADDQIHELEWEVPIRKSSWVALRHFPQMHTNPVEVLLGGQPIRASRNSALWCAGVIEQLWRMRADAIKPEERPEAEKTFRKAIDIYRQRAAEAEEGS